MAFVYSANRANDLNKVCSVSTNDVLNHKKYYTRVHRSSGVSSPYNLKDAFAFRMSMF